MKSDCKRMKHSERKPEWPQQRHSHERAKTIINKMSGPPKRTPNEENTHWTISWVQARLEPCYLLAARPCPLSFLMAVHHIFVALLLLQFIVLLALTIPLLTRPSQGPAEASRPASSDEIRLA